MLPLPVKTGRGRRRRLGRFITIRYTGAEWQLQGNGSVGHRDSSSRYPGAPHGHADRYAPQPPRPAACRLRGHRRRAAFGPRAAPRPGLAAPGGGQGVRVRRRRPHHPHLPGRDGGRGPLQGALRRPAAGGGLRLSGRPHRPRRGRRARHERAGHQADPPALPARRGAQPDGAARTRGSVSSCTRPWRASWRPRATSCSPPGSAAPPSASYPSCSPSRAATSAAHWTRTRSTCR